MTERTIGRIEWTLGRIEEKDSSLTLRMTVHIIYLSP